MNSLPIQYRMIIMTCRVFSVPSHSSSKIISRGQRRLFIGTILVALHRDSVPTRELLFLLRDLQLKCPIRTCLIDNSLQPVARPTPTYSTDFSLSQNNPWCKMINHTIIRRTVDLAWTNRMGAINSKKLASMSIQTWVVEWEDVVQTKQVVKTCIKGNKF